ncbi:MAG: DUF1926 domain-containing protein [Candidatus Omnitrophica bacterium]|nr:DUF1926 domain-containing protein [Candidatus Omnitrophota bacterium]
MDRPAVWFLMAIHCHQPVGNFGFVFDEAFRLAYEPFLTTLERHPSVRLSWHLSGGLLEWMRERRPEFLARLRRLVERGQVEMLAAGHYEPILPLIPEADRQGQVALMRQALQQMFGVEPVGLWCTERVWEPELPQTLARAGIRYTIVDANQFQVAERYLPAHLRVQEGPHWDLMGCYTIDYAGSSVALFPASKRLRYTMPFQDVPKTMEILKRLEPLAPISLTYADDGEKFGLWPKTHQWVYEEGWLERFFSALEREAEWLRTATCQEYLAQVGPQGRVQLPCGSYEEMLEWSGGSFRNFFVKYPEANAMYHRMLDVSRQIQEIPNKAKGKRQKAKLVEEARRELYMGQCNDAYWHGVFGGLYLAHLRRSVYQHLIRAEGLTRQASGSRAAREQRDLDGDGRPEVALRSRSLRVVVDPDEGGAVTEVDGYERAVNLLDTLSRRPEPYHDKLRTAHPAGVPGGSQTPASIHDLVGVKEEGLRDLLVYDDHRRSSFLDYAFSAMPGLQEIMRGTWSEHRLWSSGAWTLDASRAAARHPLTVSLVRRLEGGVMRKTVSLSPSRPQVVFRYEAEGLAIPVVGLEFNLGLQGEPWRRPGWQEGARGLEVRDASLGVGVRMSSAMPATVAHFPIETVSESEEGLERTPQGLAVVWLWATGGGRRASCELVWNIETW